MECSEARHLMVEVLSGSTPPDARRALRRHLEGCSDCRREVERLEATGAVLRSAPEPRLPEGHWVDFMAALDRRLAAEQNHPRRRFIRWLRNPVLAWGTAAATAAIVTVLGLTQLVGPDLRQVESVTPDSAPMQAFVTERMVSTMPSMDVSLAVWKASLGTSDDPYDLSGGE